jgi:hypothetical protein
MKKILLLLTSLFLAMILGFGMSCAKPPDDAKISSSIQARFSQDSGLSSKQLTIQCSNGTVTLSGTVDNNAQREAASRQAASVAGVKQVINNLQIASAGGTPAEASTPASPAAPEASQPISPPPSNVKPTPAKKSRKAHARENVEAASEAPAATASASSGTPVASNTSAPPPPAQEQPKPAAPAPPAPPRRLTLDAGTELTVRLGDTIDSEKNQTGDTFHATLNAPLSSDGEEAVPVGVDVTGHLVEVKSAGKFAGQSQVVLQLDSINVGGRSYAIQTDQYRKQASSRSKNTAEKVGGGAALGTLIGAIAGGGKGAAIGAAAGAGAGGGVQAATKSEQIKLPAETVLNFTLQAPVTVDQVPNPNATRRKLGDSQ